MILIREWEEAMRTPCYSSLDDALDEIASFSIELRNGNTNHAPMVAEALCALGHPEAVGPWLTRYRERMQPRPAAAGERIQADNWQAALGRRERFVDWAAFFAEQLEETEWRALLDHWVMRLGPGFCAAATHGVIRVGHAVRALAERETRSRRRELGDALASWTATWQRLPRSEGAGGQTVSPQDAIAGVPLVPTDQRLPGNIVQALAVLDDFPEFLPVVEMIDTSGPVAARICELAQLFARVYLANAQNIPTTIAFIHAVTSLTALGNICGYVSEATARIAIRYAWQAGCALYACYGRDAVLADRLGEGSGKGEEELARQAIANGDEHVIKFTEACLNRHAQAASPAYLAAADHANRMIRARPLI
ncbi:MAG: questin oxidase family protein [Stellaceae bacterium]